MGPVRPDHLASMFPGIPHQPATTNASGRRDTDLGDDHAPGQRQRLPLPLLLGVPALPHQHARRHARYLGPANPKIGEREATWALLERDHHLVRAGQVILGDKGFPGRDFERFINEDVGAHLIRPERKDEKPRLGKLGRIRQWIESVFDTLKGQLTLEQHGARTLQGVKARADPDSWPSPPESGTTG